MSEIMLPCPFCGRCPAEAEDELYYHEHQDDPDRLRIGHERGGGPRTTCGEEFGIRPGTVICTSEGCAIQWIEIKRNLWNTRSKRQVIEVRLVSLEGSSNG